MVKYRTVLREHRNNSDQAGKKFVFSAKWMMFSRIPFALGETRYIIDGSGLTCVEGTMSEVMVKEDLWLTDAPVTSHAPRSQVVWLTDDLSDEHDDESTTDKDRISFGWVVLVNLILWGIIAAAVAALL
jgi:hypothetical protein